MNMSIELFQSFYCCSIFVKAGEDNFVSLHMVVLWIDPHTPSLCQTYIKHIKIAHFEFYVKFYVNFCNNIIC